MKDGLCSDNFNENHESTKNESETSSDDVSLTTTITVLQYYSCPMQWCFCYGSFLSLPQNALNDDKKTDTIKKELSENLSDVEMSPPSENVGISEDEEDEELEEDKGTLRRKQVLKFSFRLPFL